MIRQVHIGISNICNMRCNHCFVKDKSPVKINLDKIKILLEILERQGLTHVYYTYGEPLLNNEIFEIADFLKKNSIYQVLMTNGTTIDSKMANKIKANGINKVMISVDSLNEKLHDNNRNYKGSLSKAISAIKILKEKNINVGIATTYMDINKNELYPIIQLLDEGLVDCVSLLAERNSGKIKTDISTDYLEIFKSTVLKNRNIIFHDLRLLDILKEMLRDCIVSKEIYNKFSSMNDCYIDKNLSVAPDGNIYKCNFINKDCIANLNNYETMEELVEIIENTKVKGCDYVD